MGQRADAGVLEQGRRVTLAVAIALLATACAHDARDAAPPAKSLTASPSRPPAPAALSPTNLPPFGRATCDSVLQGTNLAKSTLVTVVPDTVNLPDVARPETWPRRGCFVALADTVQSSGDAPNPSLEDWFTSRGWVGASWFSADGPDGTSFAYFLRDRLCLVHGRWDGGDDSDSTYVPRPGFELDMFCGPGIPADTTQ